MNRLVRRLRLAAILAASHFVYASPVIAEGWEFYGFVGTHDHLLQVADAYADVTSQIVGGGGSTGGGGTSGSTRQELQSQFALGIGADKTLTTWENGLSLGLNTEVGLAKATYVFPDGYSIFVDPITVRSTSLFTSGRLYADWKLGHFTPRAGIGALFAASKEDFYFGSIHVPEENFISYPFGFVGLGVTITDGIRVSLEGQVSDLNESASFKLEIRK